MDPGKARNRRPEPKTGTGGRAEREERPRHRFGRACNSPQGSVRSEAEGGRAVAVVDPHGRMPRAAPAFRTHPRHHGPRLPTGFLSRAKSPVRSDRRVHDAQLGGLCPHTDDNREAGDVTFVADTGIREVIVIGSGPVGCTATLYPARAELEPLVFGDAIFVGGALTTTAGIENFPGFPEGIDGPDRMTNHAGSERKIPSAGCPKRDLRQLLLPRPRHRGCRRR